MFLQYSRNGIVIGSIDDIMTGFHSLIGSINQNELPTPPSTGGYRQSQKQLALCFWSAAELEIAFSVCFMTPSLPRLPLRVLPCTPSSE